MSYLTKQEVFDKVVKHLRKQGARSVRNGKCAYRGDDGMTCAVGHLIPDDAYDARIEDMAVSPSTDGINDDPAPCDDYSVMEAVLFASKIDADDDGMLEFLQELQCAHDSGPSSWESIWRSIAKRNDLDMPCEYTVEVEERALQYVQVLA